MVSQIRLFRKFFAAFRTFEQFLAGFFLHVILQGFHIEKSEITKLATVNNFPGFSQDHQFDDEDEEEVEVKDDKNDNDEDEEEGDD